MSQIPFSYDDSYSQMLSRFLFRTARTLPALLPLGLRATITASKGLAQRKKKLYESQITDAVKLDQSQKKIQERRIRESNFEKLLFELVRDMMLSFNSRSSLQKKSGEIKSGLTKCFARLQREHKQLDARELIHFSEVVKCMGLMRLEHLQHIDVVYSVLKTFMSGREQQRELQELVGQGWEGLPLQLRVRALSIMQFLAEKEREQYLAQAAPLVRYFKSAEMLVLLYEKWRYGYVLSYQMMDQIHKNQYFCEVEDVSQSYIKMLFVDSLRGQFGPNDDSIYSRVLNSVIDRPSMLAHSAFSKLIKLLHSQNYFVQTQSSRSNLEFCLNSFINIAKNQNYEHSTLSLTQLVEIYLGFEESSSTGEILLSEITYYARVTELQINKQNFPLYQQLLLCVARNIEPKLKYEHSDTLNKEYTNDTINFLREMVPKYLPIWPEVILHLNHAAHELFLPEDPLFASFLTTYQLILQTHSKDLSLTNLPFLMSILRFLKAHQHRNTFFLPDEHYLSILGEFSKRKDQEVSSDELETLYLILSLLGNRIKEGVFRPIVEKINTGLIEARIQREMGGEKSVSPINSLDDEILWLCLCSALVRAQGFNIDQSLLEIFINEKAYYLLGTLKYMEVVEMLEFVLGLSRLKPEVYERLLYGLSTFLIFIGERTNRLAFPFYLNHKYAEQYPRLCRLVLDNHTLFHAVPDKNAFRVLQVMYFRSISQFTAEDTLRLLEILGDPAFLTSSMSRHIEDLNFSAIQLQPYENSTALKSFEYYNKSLLRFFEGKYNQAEVRNRLRGETLTRQQIQEYFSKNEVYQTIIMDGDLNIRFEMPEPNTNIHDYKLMYALQRIFQRAKQFNSYDFREDFPYSPSADGKSKLSYFTDVDFSTQKNYIDNQVLVANTSINPFRIISRTLPRYIKLEVWKSYVFFDKGCKVDSRDLEPNHKRLTDEILSKVVKGGPYGSYEKIREVLKEFSCSEELITALREAKIQFEQHGAAIEIHEEGKQRTLFTLLHSNNTSYKILYICAHYMTKHGNQVAIIKDNHKIEDVVAFLKKNFAPKKEASEAEPKQEQNQIEEE